MEKVTQEYVSVSYVNKVMDYNQEDSGEFGKSQNQFFLKYARIY